MVLFNKYSEQLVKIETLGSYYQVSCVVPGEVLIARCGAYCQVWCVLPGEVLICFNLYLQYSSKVDIN